ncbi:MAG: hypothetical protein KVP17_003856 [Porospora cf. gigantea B]|uniref:uncharacterized protein n=2 Tax=Porospora cf. gigantea B TaxID=2853592 RepID=UPI003571E5A7|nr:MAG: hypothetical protein KVP17_003856 [Porospora cf. gigantea B]
MRNQLLGGLVLGVSSVIRLVAVGRVMGVSGIVKRVVKPLVNRKPPHLQSLSWMLGFLIAAGLSMSVGGIAVQKAPDAIVARVVGSFLIAFGSDMCLGCTTGHSISGIARLSKRSMLATLLFLIAGFFTATVVGTARWLPATRNQVDNSDLLTPFLVVLALQFVASLGRLELIVELFNGMACCLGATSAEMHYPHRVSQFLDLSSSSWDWSLVVVGATACAVVAVYYALIHRNLEVTVLGTPLPPCPRVSVIDRPLILGATIFGVGMALCSATPLGTLCNVWSLDYLPNVLGLIVGFCAIQ